LGGVRFVPIRFTPNASVFKGEQLGGINIIVTNRENFEPVRTGIEIAIALRKLFPNDWQAEKINRLLANDKTLEKIKRAEAPAEIVKAWTTDLETFKLRRAQFLLYK
jgi:uncharacterized protein YbbC (DUF1343 family)